MAGRIDPGLRLSAGQDQAWVSDNGTFAFGFAPVNSRNDQFQLGIWFAQLPGDRTLVWSADINSPVTKDAILEFQTNGDLVLKDRSTTVWASNTSTFGVETASMSENGNFILYGPNQHIAWQSFSHPSDTLLPGQPLTVSSELKSSNSPSHERRIIVAINRTNSPLVLRRLILETNGNLRLYRWDNDVNGSRQWVPEWAAVSKPCDIAGICGNGICNLDRSKTNASCTCLPGTSNDGQCSGNSTLTGKCGPNHENLTSKFKISAVQQTNYYFSDSSVIANYSDIETVSKCGDACLSDCDCVASVYGLNEEKAYCWVLRDLDFGGYEDPGSTLKRILKRALENSLIVSGAPISFSYRDLQYKTSNFSQLLGTGGFGSVYKGSLSDGTLIAVKKLDRVLPHGEKEFITEVNTISSMHHMNLVRLCGYCSEGTQRLLVYEFMKNGSLDKWIFPPYGSRQPHDRLLDWSTRFQVAVVSDFGLAKLMGREASHVVTMVRGTRGYLAPEWVSNRPITVKADVYSYGMLLLEIIGGRRNLDMTYDAEDFFYPGWAFKELTNGTPTKVADRRLEGAVVEEELVRALKVAFWCIQDEIGTRPTMGEVVKMLEESVEINMPPMPQTVLELIEEGLDHVYKAMKREFNQFSSFTTISHHPSSHATCSYSSMSPR
ncbi:hypothetical protein DH2020_034458 [Rehmannia glutinosa]|uniref:Receptor-like serine/threonine-protein kinase n=1 Tax=Rehmannia glutinosa TaxID=99300 RepID=A0ABR0VD35_REHGL